MAEDAPVSITYLLHLYQYFAALLITSSIVFACMFSVSKYRFSKDDLIIVMCFTNAWGISLSKWAKLLIASLKKEKDVNCVALGCWVLRIASVCSVYCWHGVAVGNSGIQMCIPSIAFLFSIISVIMCWCILFLCRTSLSLICDDLTCKLLHSLYSSL